MFNPFFNTTVKDDGKRFDKMKTKKVLSLYFKKNLFIIIFQMIKYGNRKY